MKVGGTDAGGRARVVPDGKNTRTIEVQEVFVAIGAEAEPLWQFGGADTDAGFNFSHCRLVRQQIPLIFGGDLASPVKTVTDAIASGKQAAMVLSTYFEEGLEAVEPRLTACRVGPGPALSMNAFLGGERRGRSAQVVSDDRIVMDYFQSAPRVTAQLLDADRRRCSFTEVESGLSGEAAVREAARCFNCGTCNACDYCRLYCPEMAVKVQKSQRWIDMDYCKGCGVCATECPRNAMALEEEIK
jgi:Pyruvate/2-oxoacid:ferredoxin oxidoreductase delta subunit